MIKKLDELFLSMSDGPLLRQLGDIPLERPLNSLNALGHLPSLVSDKLV
jgi:hypothetical protein